MINEFCDSLVWDKICIITKYHVSNTNNGFLLVYLLNHISSYDVEINWSFITTMEHHYPGICIIIGRLFRTCTFSFSLKSSCLPHGFVFSLRIRGKKQSYSCMGPSVDPLLGWLSSLLGFVLESRAPKARGVILGWEIALPRLRGQQVDQPAQSANIKIMLPFMPTLTIYHY